MKKWVIWLLIIVLVALILGSIIIAISISNFSDSGVRILGQYAHVTLQRDCYFLSSDGTYTVGKSLFTVNGVVWPPKDDGSMCSFTGHMNVEAFPLSLEDGYRSTMAVVDKNAVRLNNIALSLLDPEADIEYDVTILRSNTDVVVIQILKPDDVIFAVCAESEEEAIEYFQRYIEELSQYSNSD